MLISHNGGEVSEQGYEFEFSKKGLHPSNSMYSVTILCDTSKLFKRYRLKGVVGSIFKVNRTNLKAKCSQANRYDYIKVSRPKN